MTSSGAKRAQAAAWAGWIVLFVITAAILINGTDRTVVPSYRIAALNWIGGHGLYNGDGVGGFVYLPQAAILYVPFALFPPVVGEVLWRFVIIGMLAAGLLGFARVAGARSGKDLFPLMTLITIPLAWDCARNGQSTLIMTGFMLLAAADVARSRWWRAVLWLAFAVATKPLAIVLVLLVAAVDRPMTWRVLLGMAALALFPLALQHPQYVLQQYAACFSNMTAAAHVGVAAHGWTSPFTALRVAGIDVPEKIQTAIRLAAAAGTLALCWYARRSGSMDRFAVYLFTLSTLYLMLFSPRTENNTYAMLGPAIGVFLAGAFRTEGRPGEGWGLAVIVLALLGSRTIERLVAPQAEQVWLSPFLAVCFAVYILIRFIHEMRQSPATIASASRS